MANRTSVKYINQSLKKIENKKTDTEESEQSILEQLLARGMTLPEAAVMVIDLLMAGIDTVRNLLLT